MTFSMQLPRKTGWYYVVWEPGDTPVRIWVNYFPKGTLFDGIEYWTWGRDQEDDPEYLEWGEGLFSEMITER